MYKYIQIYIHFMFFSVMKKHITACRTVFMVCVCVFVCEVIEFEFVKAEDVLSDLLVEKKSN